MPCFIFSFLLFDQAPSVFSKAHTIHIISIQIQNLSHYCSEWQCYSRIFFQKSTYLTCIFKFYVQYANTVVVNRSAGLQLTMDALK